MLKQKLTTNQAFFLGIGYILITTLIWHQFIQVSSAYFQPILSQKSQVIVEKELVEVEKEAIIPDVQIYVLSEAKKAGFKVKDINTLIGECENREWNPDKKYNNGDSVDRGIFMINDKWHPEVSNECAYNLECNVREGLRILKERGYCEWTCGKLKGLCK